MRFLMHFACIETETCITMVKLPSCTVPRESSDAYINNDWNIQRKHTFWKSLVGMWIVELFPHASQMIPEKTMTPIFKVHIIQCNVALLELIIASIRLIAKWM